MSKRKYAAVGTGKRITMFTDPIAGKYRDQAELVGLCDPSPTRRTYHQQRLLREYGLGPVPTYGDFDLMLQEQKPEVMVVCSPDYTHHEYIIKSLDAGVDVISEKPLTTDAGKCQAIFDAINRTGRSVRTTFNLRWATGVSKVRELIAQGVVGKVKHIDFEYFLNTSHGADYFRRWHSQKACSGGLLLHKSTHHIDLLNWWINGIPLLVFGLGGLVYYGKENAINRGEEERTRYSRYTGIAAAERDPFRLSLEEEPTMKELYLSAEADSGYIRDQNVFREGIDIEDSLSLLIKYRTGEMATYSLNAYSPREGFRASISGDGGRIDYEENHTSHILTSEGGVKAHGPVEMRLTVQRLFSEPYSVDIAQGVGSHGGGDVLLQEQMFSANPAEDVLGRSAGHEQGAASLLVGAAANISIVSGNSVKVADLLELNPRAVRLTDLI